MLGFTNLQKELYSSILLISCNNKRFSIFCSYFLDSDVFSSFDLHSVDHAEGLGVSLAFSPLEIVMILILNHCEIALIGMTFSFVFLGHLCNGLTWIAICLSGQFIVVWSQNGKLSDMVYGCHGISVKE